MANSLGSEQENLSPKAYLNFTNNWLPLSVNLYEFVLGNPIIYIDLQGLDAVILHGGGPGEPEGVIELGRTVRSLMMPSDPNLIPEYRPRIPYKGFFNASPTPGDHFANSYEHDRSDMSADAGVTASTPRILAGYSMGGDAALRASGPLGGGNWDLRVITGARVDEDFVDLLERAANTSDRVIVVNIRGDDNLANDIPGDALDAPQFGPRSYEAVAAAIVQRYGSVEAFYEAHPNVIIEGTRPRMHMGGGNSPELNDAIRRAFHRLEARESEVSSHIDEDNATSVGRRRIEEVNRPPVRLPDRAPPGAVMRD